MNILKAGVKISTMLILLFSILLVGCEGTTHTVDGENDASLNIYASIFPLYDFAKKIGGDFVKVHLMVPPGTESHDYEPSPRDMVALAEADVFVYNGTGFETWAEQAVDTLDEEKTHIVNTTEHLPLMTHEVEQTEHKGEHVDHHHGAYDPHVWLDPNLARQQASTIKDVLIDIDPENAKTYEANFERLSEQFASLDEALRDVVTHAERKEIIVSHEAFGYLTASYGLEQVAVSGLSPSDEPSQKELQHIIEFGQEHDVQVILFEKMVSSKVAEVVKRELGAEALTLNPMENVTKEELERGEDYYSIMEQNIQNLGKALGSK